MLKLTYALHDLHMFYICSNTNAIKVTSIGPFTFQPRNLQFKYRVGLTHRPKRVDKTFVPLKKKKTPPLFPFYVTWGILSLKVVEWVALYQQ